MPQVAGRISAAHHSGEAQEPASLYSTMEPALVLALAEALGKVATGAVLNAWKQAFRFLAERLAV
jgi:hemoglobin-like flavoprotein